MNLSDLNLRAQFPERSQVFHWLIDLFGLIVVAILVATWMRDVVKLGFRIPTSLIEIDYLKGLLWAVFLGGTILFWPIREEDKSTLICLWLAKMVFVLGVMLFMEAHYEMDAYGYFRQSVLPFLAPINESSKGSYAVVRVLRSYNLIMPASFHAQMVTFAMIGLIGIYVIYRSAVRFVGREDHRLLWFIGLIPSVVVWSSLMGKDPLVFFGIAVYAYSIVAFCTYRRIRYIALAALGIVISSLIRIWVGAIMLAAGGLLAVILARGFRKIIMLTVMGVASVLMYGTVLSTLRATSTEVLIENIENSANSLGNKGGSAQGVTMAPASGIGDLIRNAPLTTVEVLFGPLPGQVKNIFGLVASLESVALILLTIRAVLRTSLRELTDPVVFWALLFLFVWSSVNGIVILGNLGVLSRYKLQITPIFFLLLLYLGRRRANRLTVPIQA